MAANLKPINRRALRRYGEFWRALALVGNALAEAEQLAAKAADQTSRPSASGKQTAHWSAPTPEELRAAAKKAGRALHTMSSTAKKWEAELVSREWRR
jgi:hypothetical protein